MKKRKVKNEKLKTGSGYGIRRFKFFIFGFSLFTFLSGALYSQDAFEDPNTLNDARTLFNQQAVGGLSAHSEGWGFFYRRAKIKDIYIKLFYEAEAVTMHDEHEYKTTNTSQPDATGYYFGKLNGMEAIRLGGGVSRMIWRKNDLSCVQIDAVYCAGFSFAILKPVYLDILVNGPGGEPTPLPQEYNPSLDTPNNIYGRASVFDGLTQLTFYPGVYMRGGLNFDFANRHKSVKALEVGVVVDGYKNVIPMMAYAQNNQVFANLYMSISFGKRWN
jgi:hypothetical protein